MPQGGELTIETKPVSPPSSTEDREWVEISISDTGIGMTEDSKKKIFDPFFTTKKMGEGTGLGLAICEKIVKEHFGKITLESEVGGGSTFFVTLPIHEREKTDEQDFHSSPRRR
jgi:signal transduction histidine kinase